jgi:type IV pilus assembly protein PilC
MDKFKYKAYNSRGVLITGALSARTELEVHRRLRKKGFVVSKIERHIGGIKKQKKSQRGRKIKKDDLIMFTRQTAVMIGSGIPLTRALFTLSGQIDNPVFADIVRSIAVEVDGGSSFTNALRQHPKIFPPLFIGMVDSGEVSGELQKALERISEQMSKDKAIADNVKSAMTYPVLIFGFSMIVTVALLFFLVPVFEDFFPEDVEVPLITAIVFTVSQLLRFYWYVWIVVAVVLFFVGRWFLRSPFFINLYENHKFKMPIIGSLIYKIVLARFSRTLATMVDVGINVLDAMKSAGPTSGSLLVERAARNAIEEIKEGETIATTLQRSGVFTDLVVQMVSVGEESGQVAGLLDKVATFYEEEVAAAVKGLTSTIEPLMLIFVGLVVGGLLIAMYLPIFTAVATQM